MRPRARLSGSKEVDELRESEAFYRAIAEDQTDMVVRFTADHRITYANPSYCRYRGMTLEAMRGTWVYADIADSDRDEVERHYMALSRDRPVSTIEHRAIGADGELKWQQWTNRALFDAKGRLIAYQSTGRDITDRKLAEATVQESRALLRAVIDSVPGMIMVKDRGGRYVLVNEYKAKYDGRPVDWYLGKTTADLYPEQFVRERAAQEEKIIATGAATGLFEYEFVDHAGDVSHWLGHMSPVCDSTGAVNYLVSVAIDITARRRMEAALRDNQTLLRATIDTVPALIAVKDAAGRYVLVNRQHATYDNRPLDWYTGKTPADLYTEAYATAAQAREQEVLVSSVGSGLYEYEYVDPAGKSSFWLGDVSPVRDTTGAVRYLVSVAIDITDSKRNDAALRESEARFRGAFESSPHGMALVAPDGRWLEINRAVCEITGYSEEELVRIDFQSITHPEDLDLDLAYVRRVLAGEIPSYQMEKRYIRKDGRIVWILLSVSLVRDTSGRPLHFVSQIFDLTEHKRALAGLRDSETRHRAIMNSALDGIIAIDVDGRIAEFNPAAETIFGYRRDEAIGRTLDETIIPPRLRDSHREGLRRQRAGAASRIIGQRLELQAMRRDGSEFPVELAITRVDMPGGAIFIGFLRDITERKNAEMALRDSEALLRAIIDAVPAAINVKDMDGRYVMVNEYQSKYNKRPIEWYPGKSPADVYPDAYVRELRARDEQTIASGRASGFFEYSFTDVDGATSDWLTSKVRLNDEGGQARYILSASIDISDRKRSEAALRGSEQRYRQLVEATGAIPYTWDVDSRRFLFVGPQAAKLLGYPAESWTDEEFWASHLLPADRKKLIDLTRRLNDAESDHQDEYWMVAADGGARWIRDVVTFGRDHQGRRIAFGLMFDETARKQRDEQLAQARKMEALGQLTGGVAHDFNNMLMVIDGNLELLARRVGPEPRVQESLNLAREATRAGADLTNHLLAFARRQVLQPRAVDLAALMSTMREMLIRALGERIECKFVIEEGVWPVLADPGQLRSALLNLTLNARDAMPGGGLLTVTMVNLHPGQPDARILAAAEPGRYVKITVGDSGAGMTPEVMERAFEPFFTTKGSARGSGLGLSMVHGFVKQSGGHISIDSKVGAGTSIEILLPRAEMRDEIGAPAPTGQATRAVGVETILVVEDNARVRVTTVRLLEDLGYQVLEAPDGSTALAMVTDHPEIALLFSDIVMPGEFDGPALARKARALKPSLKLLLVSGFADNDPAPDSPDGPEPARLSKPYDSDQLARMIRKLLDAA